MLSLAIVFVSELAKPVSTTTIVTNIHDIPKIHPHCNTQVPQMPQGWMQLLTIRPNFPTDDVVPPRHVRPVN